MTWGKRSFDVVLALVLIVPTLFILAVLVVVLLLVEGRPIFYLSKRMTTPTRSFGLIKLRTMQHDPVNSGVTGGDKNKRISRLCRGLRKSRLDELPQLWNVLRGDMSFVGPRPPEQIYVDDFPELYAQVLLNRPGITGLASLRFYRFEERLLLACKSWAETDFAYRTRCIPRKAALDMIYQRQRSVCFDLVLIWQTAKHLLLRG
jgi:lipopolysaccharide/colanic/teichoic acid biosynthesis glycosyltransferase